MRAHWFRWLAILGLASLMLPPRALAASRPAAGSALDTLVAAERAFSKLSVTGGMKQAFLAYLAHDAVVFRPAPMNGPGVWRARQDPPGRLVWEPAYAELAGAGDLGVTTGPWEYRQPPGGREPTAYGHFFSVWKRAPDGEWRVALDIGIEHERPGRGVGSVSLTRGPEHERPRPLPRDFGGLGFGAGLMAGGSGMGFATGPGNVPHAQRLMARAVNEMMGAERAIFFEARTRGMAAAYPAHAAADVRCYRPGRQPVVGAGEALAIMTSRDRRAEIVPYGDGMSSSRDLGYSYGLITRREKSAARADTCSYLHVWRRDAAGRWKLAADVENEFPRRR